MTQQNFALSFVVQVFEWAAGYSCYHVKNLQPNGNKSHSIDLASLQSAIAYFDFGHTPGIHKVSIVNKISNINSCKYTGWVLSASRFITLLIQYWIYLFDAYNFCTESKMVIGWPTTHKPKFKAEAT